MPVQLRGLLAVKQYFRKRPCRSLCPGGHQVKCEPAKKKKAQPEDSALGSESPSN